MAPVITRPVSEENLVNSYNEHIALGEYLFLRIAQANPKLKSIFGIPGDFNLRLLEHLYADSVLKDQGIDFVGICNELNAAYAADGYAKVIEGLSVLITTFGVGELSAINGVAGAYAEYAPVMHIVGTTSRKQIEQAQSATGASVKNIHHLLPNKNALLAPNHDVFKNCVDGVSVIQESLTGELDDLDKIDRVITTILQESRPGYLFIPSDVPDVFVPRSRLSEPLKLSELRDQELLNDIADAILEKLYKAEKPSVLGDALVTRFGAQREFTKFVESMPKDLVKLFTTNMGRNIDETLPNFVGTYFGALTADKRINAALENNSDLLLNVGYFNNESNTGNYTYKLENIKQYVEIHPDYILMDGEYTLIKNQKGVRAFSLKDLMTQLAARLDTSRFVYKSASIDYKYSPRRFTIDDQVDARVITQNKLIDFFNDYLQPNDILMVETCSFLFAVADLKFPKGVSFFSQNFYGSIGYALPATLGVSRAERDLGTNRRVVLVQGDGSAQMTIQELSSYLRHDIQPPKIFLLNNEGYTVERVILGPTRSYNDIQDTWRWTDFFKIFGDPNGEKHTSRVVGTAEELSNLLTEPDSGKIDLFELQLPKMDVPQRFTGMLGR